METFWIAIDKLITCFITHLYVFHPVIVLGIVDAGGRANDQSGMPFDKLSVQVGAMGMERTDAVRSIHEVLLFRLGNDVDCATQRIRTQRGRYYAFIDFHPVDQVNGQVCERYAAPFAIQRHTVDEVAHGITGQSVDREVEIRTYAPLFTYFDTSRAID